LINNSINIYNALINTKHDYYITALLKDKNTSSYNIYKILGHPLLKKG